MHGPVSNSYTAKENHKWRLGAHSSQRMLLRSLAVSSAIRPVLNLSQEVMLKYYQHLAKYHCKLGHKFSKYMNVSMYAAISGRPYSKEYGFRPWGGSLHTSHWSMTHSLFLLVDCSIHKLLEYSACGYPSMSYRIWAHHQRQLELTGQVFLKKCVYCWPSSTHL